MGTYNIPRNVKGEGKILYVFSTKALIYTFIGAAIGGVLYLLSALLNIYILKFLDYSVVLPLTSITYIWTLILSYKLLHEKISKKKIIGVAFIVLGAVLVGIKVWAYHNDTIQK